MPFDIVCLSIGVDVNKWSFLKHCFIPFTQWAYRNLHITCNPTIPIPLPKPELTSKTIPGNKATQAG